MFRVFINIDCNKLGQTSRLVARAQIQTSCNREKNVCNCIWVLDFVYSVFVLLFAYNKAESCAQAI